ncbi:tetratricopeptide repeat protein [Stygiobacter electus]|uniref:Tetratricopeptide repeat protein n=1 Tax=Stygiobacter electus TaxID=3032292 RepID=A0AAE3NY73_9BACT|nr:tetratricopeptide repeat protein [Stygiobacter electus]MBI5476153.1 tetratricopeptide repeat protein [Ignavibacteriales bacterium]MDF1613121.1 tetratricopeptide repeat protein [Stygiobacter electus]
MKKSFSKNIVFVCWFLAVLYSGIIAQSANGSVNKTIEQSNLLNQTVDGENSLENIRKYYEKILETDSTNYDAFTNLGVIWQQKGDMEKSLGYFEKAVKFHPKRARAYHNLGILNSIIGNLDEAVVNLNKAAELDSNSPNSIRQLGIIYLQNEKLNEAIGSFNCALMRDNKDTESYLGKSLAYWLLKDYDKVLAVVGEMRSLGLRFNRMELLLADVYFKKKDYENAMKYAKLDETENSSKAEGHYLLGVLYEINGEKNKAELEFEEATSITQQNPQASLELSINIFFNAGIKRTDESEADE